MRFIVIGASGFVGSRIASHLLLSGYDVVGTCSGKNVNSGLIKYDLLSDRIVDCIPKEFVKKGDDKVYAVVCAAVSRISECFLNREKSYKLNVEKTIDLLSELRQLGIKPVFFSSSQVFDGRLGFYNEEDEPNPLCEYGKQKLEVERFILKEIPDSIIIRTDKVIDDSYIRGQTLSDWYDAAKAKKTLYCIEGKTMSPTAVDDMAKAVRLLCEKDLSGIYHVVNPELFTRQELTEEFIKTLGIKVDIISKPLGFFNFVDGYSVKTHLDSSKFINATRMRFTTMKEVFDKFCNCKVIKDDW